MTAAPDDWETVTEARVPLADLSHLAALRDRRDIRVLVADGVAWVRWTASRAGAVRALLPLPEAVFFRLEHGVRYRFGSRLPTGETPPTGDARPLASVLVPRAIQPAPPVAGETPRIPLRLVRGGRPQPATALLCPLAALRAWADTATTAELAGVFGLLSGDRAVLFGPTLPALPDAVRFHGSDVLIPVGFRLEPDLPAAVVRPASGAEPGQVLLVTADGWDRIPRDRAEPLTRAGLRLALSEVARR